MILVVINAVVIAVVLAWPKSAAKVTGKIDENLQEVAATPMPPKQHGKLYKFALGV